MTVMSFSNLNYFYFLIPADFDLVLICEEIACVFVIPVIGLGVLDYTLDRSWFFKVVWLFEDINSLTILKTGADYIVPIIPF